MSKVQEAVTRFQGCNCAQSIISTYGPEVGMDKQKALQLAVAFGNGMGMGETCGAVSGALMVLGLRHAGDDPCAKEAKGQARQRAQAFAQSFAAVHGTVRCSALVGCDMGTAEGYEQARSQNLFGTLCPKFVQTAAELLEAEAK
ncbi:MAG TPA: C-GCAxxG-C-C family protein [Symbiobacteriaceae bacterium]|jgi:C_GCAxxG_C_C family probable redox protein